MFASSHPRRFQRGLDTAAARAERHNATLSLRRKQREQHLQKKVRLLSSRLPQKYNSYGNKDDSKLGEERDENNNNNTNNSNRASEKAYKKFIPKYIAAIMQTDVHTLQLDGLMSIRKLVSVEREPPINDIISSGVIPRIIQFMYCSNYKLVFESAWIITNIAASTSKCTQYIVKHGAINAFINVLLNNNFNNDIEIMIQGIWGLGNICGETEFRNKMISTEICNNIISILLSFEINNGKENENNNIQIIDLYRNGMWFINQIIRNNTKHLTLQIFNNKFTNLFELIHRILLECADDLVISDSLWCLNYISNSSNDSLIESIVKFKDNILISLCMKLLSSEFGKYEVGLSTDKSIKDAILTLNSKIYCPCLRFIGNILTGNDEMTQCVLECGYLDCIEPYLNHMIPTQRREIMWSLSNIFAGNQQQIEYILSREKIMKSIINCAATDINSVRNEAIICICNAVVEAIPTQKKQLVEYGSIKVLCAALNPTNKINETYLATIIDGLKEFLKTFPCSQKYTNPFALQIEENKGLDYLEEILTDEKLSQNIYEQIIELIKKYWDDDQEIHANNNENEHEIHVVQPTINQKTNQFNFGTNTTTHNNSNENNNKLKFNF